MSGLNPCLLAFALVLAPEGEAASFAVLPLDVEGQLPEHVTRELQASLTQGLRRGGGEATDAVRKRCEDDACVVALAKKSKSSHVVRGTLTVSGPDYRLRLELLDGGDGHAVASVEDTCEVCGFAELGEMTADAAATLRARMDASAQSPPTLVVQTTPAGALVRVDGAPVGKTPLEVEVGAGEHDVVVELEGHAIHRRRIGSVEGVEERFAVTMQPLDPARGRHEPGARAMVGAGAAALLVGLAGVGVGASHLALDGTPIRSQCGGDDVDADGDCRWNYDTLGSGIALTAVGGAVAVAGAVVLALGLQRMRGPRAHAFVTPRGLGLAGRF